MRANTMLECIRAGSSAICGQLVTASSVAAEILAHEAFDGVVVDLQHSELDLAACVHSLQALSTTSVTPLVRVSWNDPAEIMQVLDAGALGVICPMINNRDECERFVRAAHYPPAGFRSYGPLRAELYGGSDYARHANTTILTLAMIETAEALTNLGEIMTTPGLSGVYIGPSDLSAALGGRYAPDWRFGPVRDAIDDVLALAATTGRIAGIYVHSPEYGREMVELGFSYVVLQSDAVFLQRQSELALSIVRPQATSTGSVHPKEVDPKEKVPTID